MEIFRVVGDAQVVTEPAPVRSERSQVLKPPRSRENAAKMMQPTFEVRDFLNEVVLDRMLSWSKYFENHRRQGYLFCYAFAELTPVQAKQPADIRFPNCDDLRFVAVYIGESYAIVSVSTKLLLRWLNKRITLMRAAEGK